jgi:hypothetical protein
VVREKESVPPPCWQSTIIHCFYHVGLILAGGLIVDEFSTVRVVVFLGPPLLYSKEDKEVKKYIVGCLKGIFTGTNKATLISCLCCGDVSIMR